MVQKRALIHRHLDGLASFFFSKGDDMTVVGAEQVGGGVQQEDLHRTARWTEQEDPMLVDTQ